MIATKRDPVTFRDLGSASLPGGIEAINVVRPNALVFDADIFAVAFDGDLAVVMNVGVGHATAGPDANPSTAVQTCLAVFDYPSSTFPGVDSPSLRSACELLDRDVADQHVGCRAFERK